MEEIIQNRVDMSMQIFFSRKSWLWAWPSKINAFLGLHFNAGIVYFHSDSAQLNLHLLGVGLIYQRDSQFRWLNFVPGILCTIKTSYSNNTKHCFLQLRFFCHSVYPGNSLCFLQQILLCSEANLDWYESHCIMWNP